MSDKEAYIIGENVDARNLTMRTRRPDNCICIPENHSIGILKEADIAFLRQKTDEYCNLIGNHIDNIFYLSESERELARSLELIRDKIYEMRLSMYDD